MIDTRIQADLISEREWLHHFISGSLIKNHAIALWKTPGKEEKNLLVSLSGVKRIKEVSLEESDPGFIFAPFTSETDKFLFPADLIYRFEQGKLVSKVQEDSTLLSTPAQPLSFHTKPCLLNSRPPDFKDLVQKSIKAIEQGHFEKVVPSRFEDVPITSQFNVLQAFEELCTHHPQALVSLVSAPETGTWLGATPELLVSVVQNKFKTVALAGTLPYGPNLDLKKVAWTQKEIEEQAFVCRYIINCFKKIRLREYEEHGPKTIVSGNLMHLKTEYEVDMLSTNFPQLGTLMLKLLHPTSAVCGMPLENSLRFLKDHEGYDREFYSGYLGPINLKSESFLYVNLRCLQLLPTTARCYAGAGVTADSSADQEWNETEIKLVNLKKNLVQ